MTPEEMRLECLRLAVGEMLTHGGHAKAEEVVARATTYADFVLRHTAHPRPGSHAAEHSDKAR